MQCQSLNSLTANIKCVVVGDDSVGKTCLVITHGFQEFPYDCVPMVYDNISSTTLVDNYEINLSLWDTGNQDDYQKLRVSSYPQTDVFLLCYSVVNVNSFNNVRSKWYPELIQHCPDAKIILVGTKTDLRNDERMIIILKERKCKPVTTAEGVKLARDIHAVKYMECSAKMGQGVKSIFDEVIRSKIKPKTLQCRIL